MHNQKELVHEVLDAKLRYFDIEDYNKTYTYLKSVGAVLKVGRCLRWKECSLTPANMEFLNHKSMSGVAFLVVCFAALLMGTFLNTTGKTRLDNKESSDVVAHAAHTSKRRCSVRLQTVISDTLPSSDEVKVDVGATAETQLSKDASVEVNATLASVGCLYNNALLS